MKFETFVHTYGGLPLIESLNLFEPRMNENALRVQLSRWVKSGKLIQLTRGVYVLAEAHRKIPIYEPFIAASLKWPSYLSLEKALEYHDLIPESVFVYTSVTTKRPGRYETPLGNFGYRHIRSSLFWGYGSVTVNGQTGYMALPEKALLDLIYLRPINVSIDYFEELRLQNVEKIKIQRLLEFAGRFGKPRMVKAAKCLQEFIHGQRKEGKKL